MMTLEPIANGELLTRTGRPGVLYKQNDESGAHYVWNGAGFSLVPMGKQTTAVTGTATLTAAELMKGTVKYTGGAGTATLPTATLLGAAIGAKAGSVFDFQVDNTAGSGTCTVAVGTGIVAGPAVITGGATLTVAASATQGIGCFRCVFSSSTAAVLFRIG